MSIRSMWTVILVYEPRYIVTRLYPGFISWALLFLCNDLYGCVSHDTVYEIVALLLLSVMVVWSSIHLFLLRLQIPVSCCSLKDRLAAEKFAVIMYTLRYFFKISGFVFLFFGNFSRIHLNFWFTCCCALVFASLLYEGFRLSMRVEYFGYDDVNFLCVRYWRYLRPLK